MNKSILVCALGPITIVGCQTTVQSLDASQTAAVNMVLSRGRPRF